MELFEMVQYTQWLPELGIGIVASATAAYIVGALHMRRVYRQKYKAAVTRFVREMGKVIDLAYHSSYDDKTNPRVVRTEARVIVSVRNSFQSVLSSMKEVLNSNIDRLAKELDILEQHPNDERAQEAVRETIMVIKKTWPAKSTEVEIVLRKLLSELGLKEI